MGLDVVSVIAYRECGVYIKGTVTHLTRDTALQVELFQPMAPRKITVVSHFGWGMYRYRLEFLRELVRAGWQVTAIADWRDGPYESLVRAEGVHTQSMRLTRSRLDVFGDIRTVAQLYRLYRDVKPDVAQHFHTRPMILGAIAARLARVPRIVNCVTGLGMLFSGELNLLRRLARPLYKLAFGGGIMAVFQNATDLERLVSAGIVTRDNAVLVAGSGIDTQALKPDPDLPPEKRDVVVMASRMIWSKGVEAFAEAAAILKPRFPHVRFILAGGVSKHYGMHASDDVGEEWLRKMAAQGAVEWPGHVAPEVVEDLFRRAAAVVLPSFYPEGIPRCLIEGAAAGAPIVTTDMPGCRDAVVPGVSGLLCTPRSAQQLADAIAAILSDPVVRARMSVASRRLAVEKFDVRAIAAVFLALYQQARSGSGPKPLRAVPAADGDEKEVCLDVR
jgi:glycosyltransferase involved in cell wall biosynthesis